MCERSRVRRSLESHGVHVRSSRTVRMGKDVLRRQRHLVSHRRGRHGLSGSGSSSRGGIVVEEVLAERRSPSVKLVHRQLDRHGCRAVLFRGGEGSVAHVVEGLGWRGKAISVARGSAVVGTVVSDGFGEVERVGQGEKVLVLHRAAGHGHGFHCGGHRGTRCQGFLGFVFLVGFESLRLADRVVVLVVLGVCLSALDKDSGVSV